MIRVETQRYSTKGSGITRYWKAIVGEDGGRLAAPTGSAVPSLSKGQLQLLIRTGIFFSFFFFFKLLSNGLESAFLGRRETSRLLAQLVEKLTFISFSVVYQVLQFQG